MKWRYDESKKDDAEFLRKFIAFLQSCITQTTRDTVRPERPEFVPCIISIPKEVRSEAPIIFKGVVVPGVYAGVCNQWGAISVTDSTGRQMGIRPDECIVVEMCLNPHLQRNHGEDEWAQTKGME